MPPSQRAWSRPVGLPSAPTLWQVAQSCCVPAAARIWSCLSWSNLRSAFGTIGGPPAATTIAAAAATNAIASPIVLSVFTTVPPQPRESIPWCRSRASGSDLPARPRRRSCRWSSWVRNSWTLRAPTAATVVVGRHVRRDEVVDPIEHAGADAQAMLAPRCCATSRRARPRAASRGRWSTCRRTAAPASS